MKYFELIKTNNEVAMIVDGEQYAVGKLHGNAPAPPAEQARSKHLIQRCNEVVRGARSTEADKVSLQRLVAHEAIQIEGRHRPIASVHSNLITPVCNRDAPKRPS